MICYLRRPRARASSKTDLRTHPRSRQEVVPTCWYNTCYALSTRCSRGRTHRPRSGLRVVHSILVSYNDHAVSVPRRAHSTQKTECVHLHRFFSGTHLWAGGSSEPPEPPPPLSTGLQLVACNRKFCSVVCEHAASVATSLHNHGCDSVQWNLPSNRCGHTYNSALPKICLCAALRLYKPATLA